MSSGCRLYLITPPQIEDLDQFVGAFAAAFDGGDIACVQLRLKSDAVETSDDDILRAAERLMPITHEHDAAFLINDRPDLALKLGADGVHIGQSDTPSANARAILGDDATVGVTCHNSKHLALEAGENGADYVAFGAFFPTTTKSTEHIAETSLVEWWTFATTVPCVAIGGITPENCGPIVRAGADFVATSSAIWEHEAGPAAAVKKFTQAIRDV